MPGEFALVGLYEEGVRVSDNTQFSAEMGAGRYAEAAIRLRRDLSLDPGSLFLKVALGNALYLSNDSTTAMEIYSQLMGESERKPLPDIAFSGLQHTARHILQTAFRSADSRCAGMRS